MIMKMLPVLFVMLLLPSVSAIQDVCTLGDLKCNDDLHTVSYCWDENQDGYLEWTQQDTYYCELPCGEIVEMSGHNVVIEDFSDCFPTQPIRACDVCADGETICSIDGSTILTCYDSNGDGCHQFEEEGLYCQYGCNYIFTPIAVGGKEGADCNPGPNYCPLQCSIGEEYCHNDGHSWTACVEDVNGCPSFSEEYGYCEFGCDQWADGIRCLDPPIWIPDEYDVESDPYTIAYYSFDDGNDISNIVDYGPFGYNLTLNNASNDVGSFVNGFSGLALNSSGYSCRWDSDFYNDNYGLDSFPNRGSYEFYFQYNDDSGNDDADFLKAELVNTGFYFVVYMNSDRIHAYMYGNWNDNDAEIYYYDTFDDGDWHHVLMTWDHLGTGKVKLYFDGKFVGEDDLPSSPRYSLSSPYRLRIGNELNDVNGIFKVDEIRFSSTVRTISDCDDLCERDGQRRCEGFNLYSRVCEDSNSDGCLDWSGQSDFCDFGCNPETGSCFDADNRFSICDIGDFKCGDSSRYPNEYEIPCDDVDNDSFNEWDYADSNVCDYGCNPDTGRCNPPFDACGSTETFCCRDFVDTPFGMKLNSVCNCADWDNDGYLDKGAEVIQFCGSLGWCDDDNYPNGTNYAWCNSIEDEIIYAKTHVDAFAAITDTAIPEGARTLMAFGISGIVFVIFSIAGSVRGRGGGSALGGVAALVMIICFTLSGWVAPVFALVLVAISGFFLFAQFRNGGGSSG
jgi:hypothetical protein